MAVYYVLNHDWQAAVLLPVNDERAERLADSMEEGAERAVAIRSLVRGKAEVLDVFCRRCRLRWGKHREQCIVPPKELTVDERRVHRREGRPLTDDPSGMGKVDA